MWTLPPFYGGCYKKATLKKGTLAKRHPTKRHPAKRHPTKRHPLVKKAPQYFFVFSSLNN